MQNLFLHLFFLSRYFAYKFFQTQLGHSTEKGVNTFCFSVGCDWLAENACKLKSVACSSVIGLSF